MTQAYAQHPCTLAVVITCRAAPCEMSNLDVVWTLQGCGGCRGKSQDLDIIFIFQTANRTTQLLGIEDKT